MHSIDKGPYQANLVQEERTKTQSKDMIVERLQKQAYDKMCIRELQGALPPVVYSYIRGCRTK